MYIYGFQIGDDDLVAASAFGTVKRLVGAEDEFLQRILRAGAAHGHASADGDNPIGAGDGFLPHALQQFIG